MYIKHVCIEFEIYVLSCQVYITFSENVPIDYDIEVGEKSIKIRYGEKEYTLNVKEYSFEESYARDIKVYGNKLLFRAQLNSCPKTESSSFSFTPTYMPKLKTAKEVFIKCSSCKTLLFNQPISFCRILPEELCEVDHMFCHGGTENLGFQHQENDCFYDKVSIFIKNKNLTTSNSFKCQSCNLCLGVGLDYGLRLWLDSISLKFDNDDEQTNASPYDCFALIVDNIIKTMLGPISHNIMKYTDSKNLDHYLLMKVIKKSELAISFNPNNSNDLTLDRKNCSSIIWHTSSEFVEKWKNDYVVMEIQVSERMYESAITHLTKSNQQFLTENCLSGKEKSRKSYLFDGSIQVLK